MGAHAERVEQHLALVVGGTPAEDLAILLGRLEWLVVPAIRQGRRLNIVVPVDEDPRGIRVAGGPVRVDGGQALGFPYLGDGEPPVSLR